MSSLDKTTIPSQIDASVQKIADAMTELNGFATRVATLYNAHASTYDWAFNVAEGIQRYVTYLASSPYETTLRSPQVQENLPILPDKLILEVVALLHRLDRLEEANKALKRLELPDLPALVVQNSSTASISVPATPINISHAQLSSTNTESPNHPPQQSQTSTQPNPNPQSPITDTLASLHPILTTPITEKDSLNLLANTTIDNTPATISQPLPHPDTAPAQTTNTTAHITTTPTPLHSSQTTPSTTSPHQAIKTEVLEDLDIIKGSRQSPKTENFVLALRHPPCKTCKGRSDREKSCERKAGTELLKCAYCQEKKKGCSLITEVDFILEETAKKANRWIVTPSPRGSKRKYEVVWTPTMESSHAPAHSSSTSRVETTSLPIDHPTQPTSSADITIQPTDTAEPTAQEQIEALEPKPSKKGFVDYVPVVLESRTRIMPKRKVAADALDVRKPKRSKPVERGIIIDESKPGKGKSKVVETDVEDTYEPLPRIETHDQTSASGSGPSNRPHTSYTTLPTLIIPQSYPYQNPPPTDPSHVLDHAHDSRTRPTAPYIVHDNRAHRDYSMNETLGMTGTHQLPASHPIEKAQIHPLPDPYFANNIQLQRAKFHSRIMYLSAAEKVHSAATEMRVILDYMRRRQRNAEMDLMAAKANYERAMEDLYENRAQTQLMDDLMSDLNLYLHEWKEWYENDECEEDDKPLQEPS